MVRMYNNINSIFRGLTTTALTAMTNIGNKAITYIQDSTIYHSPNIVIADVTDKMENTAAILSDTIQDSAEFISQYANIAGNFANAALTATQDTISVMADSTQTTIQTINDNWDIVEDNIDTMNEMLTNTMNNVIATASSTAETVTETYYNAVHNYHVSIDENPYLITSQSVGEWDLVGYEHTDYWVLQ